MKRNIKKVKTLGLKELRKFEKAKLESWRIACLERDGMQCVYCGATKYVHVHHIVPREIKVMKYDTENGICLCAKHHKFSIEFSAHKNAFAFINWLRDNRPKQYTYLSIFTQNLQS